VRFFVAAGLLVVATAVAAEPGTWIDLTHPFDAATIYWPTEKGFQFEAGANIPIFENVAAFDQVPDTGAFIVALPMKIAGGSGGPLRIVARLP